MEAILLIVVLNVLLDMVKLGATAIAYGKHHDALLKVIKTRQTDLIDLFIIPYTDNFIRHFLLLKLVFKL